MVGSLRWRHVELAADGAGGVVVHLAVPGDGTLPQVGRVHPDGMTAAFSQQSAAVRPQVLQQVHPLHDTAPVGTSRTSLLASRCR